MFRKRQGKKEKNVWKQYIQPLEDPSLPKLFVLTDQTIKETKKREVYFKIAYWKEKMPYARLVEHEPDSVASAVTQQPAQLPQ